MVAYFQLLVDRAAALTTARRRGQLPDALL
jgi:hypothetical protein